MIDLRSDFLEIVISILEKHIPNTKVWAFGSRVTWTAKEFSDLDLAIVSSESLDKKTLVNLEEAFEESDLPIKVDVVEFKKVSKEFQKIIKRNYEVLISDKDKKENKSIREKQLPDGWQVCTLGDNKVTSIIGDGLHGTPEYDGNGEYYFINGNNLASGRITISDSMKRATKEEYLKYKKNLNDRTILVSINGTLGNIALYNNEKVILGKSACYLNIDNNIDRKFIFYVLSNTGFQSYISSLATGSTIKNVSLKLMRDFTFLLPPPPEQKAIARILGSLDDKIEINRKLNKTLEEIAQTIFKSWFVDFDPVKRNMNPQPPERGLLKSLVPEALAETGHLKYNKELIPTAQQNRNNPTEAEKRIWDELLKGEKTGYKFRQQKPIDNFILDFYCSALLLGIEVDGRYHEDKKQKEQDINRQEKLEQLGLRIIRYTNEQVLNNFDFVQKDLIEKINQRTLELSSFIELEDKISSDSPLSGGWGFDHLFPSEFEERELGLIPKGWRVDRLKENFELVMGQSPPGESYNEEGKGIVFFQGRTDFGFRFPSNRIYCTDPKRFADKFNTLVSVRAPVGDINMVKEKCCIGRGLACVSNKGNFYSYTYHCMHSIMHKFKAFDTNGTVFGSINKTDFENIKLINPKPKLVELFDSLIQPIDQKIFEMESEIQNLQQIRDSLLPKLISGKIRVSPSEIS